MEKTTRGWWGLFWKATSLDYKSGLTNGLTKGLTNGLRKAEGTTALQMRTG